MSNYIVTVEEKMKSEAEFGFFYLYTKLTKKKAQELRSLGFFVFDSRESKNFPRLHKIDWKQSVVECNDVHSLNEKDSQYTLPQKLWITAMKNQPTDK